MNEQSAEAFSRTGPAPPGALSWEIDVPLITNPLVRRQLLLVAVGAGLVMALLMTFVFATTSEFDAIPMMWLISLLAAAGLGVLLFVVALVFFGNRVRVRFTLDEAGVLWETVDQRARTGSRLALLAGLLGASPQTAGAGALGMARETEFVRWEQVARVASDPRHRMVILRGSWRPVMMVVCRPEDYDNVVAHAKRKVVPESAAAVAPAWRGPLGRALLRTVIVALAAAPTFALSATLLDLDLLLPLITFSFALATVWLIPLFGWVVIGCVFLLVAQLTWLGVADFRYLYGAERALFLLAYIGLGLLAFLGWRALRGKLLPPLLEP